MRHLKDCPATDGFGCRCNDIRGRPSWQKRYGKRDKRKIRVPSLPVLAHLLYRISVDYKCAYTKEVAEFCKQYTPYVAEALKPGTPEAAWHKRARDIANSHYWEV